MRTIFDDALRQTPEERPQFVRQACGENEELQTEVESLLASLDSAENFLETPAVVQIVENTPPLEHLLSPGQILGHYEIGDLIGTGGMGEVYLARDTRLNRRVAIKLLRDNFLPDVRANQRLLREAQAAALLEHPNICQIYEIAETSDHCFIVMQYVVGTTLADFLAKGPLGAALSLDLAVQIADGLAEAHDQGIIHRDIKPANVIVNDKGQAKILDFGLAKFIEAETNVQTSQRLKSSGQVMGTVPFMSPEQLRGKILDQRTDIFSLGALLYETVSGQPAFTRESNAEAIAAILNTEPDWSCISEQLRPILQKCLAKEKADRYSSARDLSRDLENLRNISTLEEPVWSHKTKPSRSIATTDVLTTKKRQFHFWQSSGDSSRPEQLDSGRAVAKTRRFGSIGLAAVAVVLLLLGATAILVWKANTVDNAPNLDSLRLVPLVSWKTGIGSGSSDARVSHDGKMIAYSSSRQGGNHAIFIKQTSGGGEEFQVAGNTWDNIRPLWAPEDQRIAFVSVRQDQPGIYMSAFLGGVVTPLLFTEKANISLRHWALDGSAIFYEEMGNLYRLDLETRERMKVTHFADSKEGNDRYFAFSPDEKQIVFCDTRDDQTDIWTVPIGGGEPTRITNDKERELRPLWHPDGRRIIYNVVRDELFQINFIRVGGAPVQLTRGEADSMLIDISQDGGRIYYQTSEKKSDISSIDLESLRDAEVAAEPAIEVWADASPDGRSVVFQVNPFRRYLNPIDGSALVIKSYEGQTKQLPGKGSDPKWLPDSRHISVFRESNEKKGEFEAWLIDTVTGEETRITKEDVMTPSYSVMPITRGQVSVRDFSPDGGRFVYIDNQKTQNVKIGRFNGGDFTNLTKNENPNVRYFSPIFSHDGSRIAIVSLEQFQEKGHMPVSRVKISGPDNISDIFSTSQWLRLLGWSSASEVILATAKERIAAMPLNLDILTAALNGENRKLFSLEGVYPRTLTLSPDGRTLAFTARRNGRDNIWTLALTRAAEETKVTFNADSALFLTNLAFSSNGKTIYFDKQGETSTISMIENFY